MTFILQHWEYIKCLKYKLLMMRIPCDEPAYVEADNQSILCNTRDEWKTTYVSTHDNEVDLLIKQLESGPRKRNL